MKNLHRHDITLYHTPTIDGSGRETWTTSVTVKGRFSQKVRRIIDEQGEETRSDAECWVINTNGELDDVSIGDRLDYNGQYRIINLQEATKANGDHHHFQLMLRRWQ